MTREERIAIYTNLCTQGKIKALFMQPWWLDVTGHWDVSLGVRNGQVVGALPFGVIKKWGLFLKIGMPKETHHLQIWMDKPPDVSEHKWLTREKQIIWLILDNLPKFHIFSMVFEEKSFDNWLPFHWRGFRQEMRYTFVIHRDTYLEKGLQVNRNLRRNIKAGEGELSIRMDVDLHSFYKVCQATYVRQQQTIPFTFDFIEKLNEAVEKKHAGKKLGAYTNEGTLVAVAWLLWDSERAYYFIAGDTDAGRELGASLIVCHEALHTAFEERQISTFDFCGSMIEPVAEIRRQFGAQATGLMKIYKSRWKIGDMLYSLTR